MLGDLGRSEPASRLRFTQSGPEPGGQGNSEDRAGVGSRVFEISRDSLPANSSLPTGFGLHTILHDPVRFRGIVGNRVIRCAAQK